MQKNCQHRQADLFSRLVKGGFKPISRDRLKARTLEKRLKAKLASFLAEMASDAAKQLSATLGLSKAAKEPTPDDIESAIEELDLSAWRAIIQVAGPELTEMAVDGGTQALRQLGVIDDAELLDLMRKRAEAFAQGRAAELVGMKYVDGELVENPDAIWRIDEATREMIKGSVDEALANGATTDELAGLLSEQHAFSDWRAETIARTELAFADSQGALTGYRESGLVAGKEWITAEDDLVSDICVEAGSLGVIGLEDKYPTGVDAPPNHPNCRCVIVPVLNEEKVMKNQLKMYAEIAKSEKQDDGTLKVWGWASSEAVDSEGEVITADAMKGAIPEYMKFGAVREMHDAKKAAGTAIEATVNDEGKTWFGAHVVDPVAVKKCETGVYKGFSIGGRVTARDEVNKNTITGLNLVEVSLVDRPANPESVFEVFKAEKVDEPLAKGMYGLRQFAEVLQSITYMVSDAQWEADSEKDGSTVPQALREWLEMGVMVFQEMSAEETAELIASVNTMKSANAGDLTKAAGADDLAKAGAKYSKEVKSALAKIHGMLDDCCTTMKSMGYMEEATEEKPDGEAEKSATPDDQPAADGVEKGAGVDASENIPAEVDEAASAELGALLKAAGITDTNPIDVIKSLASKALKAQAELDVFKAQPAPAKAALMAVSKAEDQGGSDPTKADIVKRSDGTVDEVATLIKSAQAKPRPVYF